MLVGTYHVRYSRVAHTRMRVIDTSSLNLAAADGFSIGFRFGFNLATTVSMYFGLKFAVDDVQF